MPWAGVYAHTGSSAPVHACVHARAHASKQARTQACLHLRLLFSMLACMHARTHIYRMRWFFGIFLVGFALEAFFNQSLTTKFFGAFASLLVTVPLMLCLRVSVIKRLAGHASMYYYMAAIVGGRVTDVWIWYVLRFMWRFLCVHTGTGTCAWMLFRGPQFWTLNGHIDTARVIGYSFEATIAACGLMVSLPLWDAVPIRIASLQVRRLYCLSIAGFKSAHSCIVSNPFLMLLETFPLP